MKQRCWWGRGAYSDLGSGSTLMLDGLHQGSGLHLDARWGYVKDHVYNLGVLLAPGLLFDKQVAVVASNVFFTRFSWCKRFEHSWGRGIFPLLYIL